jgi:hypothetical protein
MRSLMLRSPLVLAVVLAGVAGCSGSGAGPGPDAGVQPIAFADTALEACVREAIERPSEPLFPDDVAGLQHLSCTDRGITSIAGIQHLTGLLELSLFENSISDASPLAGLSNLVVLQLGNNAIEDLSPLASLTGLERLGLGRNRVAVTEPLSGLTALRSLNLDHNSLEAEDLQPILGLPNLRWLTVEHNSIEDLSALATLEANGCNVYADFNTARVAWRSLVAPRLSAAPMPRAGTVRGALVGRVDARGVLQLGYRIGSREHPVRSTFPGRLRVDGTGVWLEREGLITQVGTLGPGGPSLCEGAHANTCRFDLGAKAGPGRLPGAGSAAPVVTATLRLVRDQGRVPKDSLGDWAESHNGLLPLVLASPNQYDAGSCLFMACTGAMELLLKLHLQLLRGRPAKPGLPVHHRVDERLGERHRAVRPYGPGCLPQLPV